MKKKGLIIGSIILCTIIVLILFSNAQKNKCYNESLEKIEDLLAQTQEYLNRQPIFSSGNIVVNAKYRGAHGENFPSTYTYAYEINEKEITFANEDGYNSAELPIDITILKEYNIQDLIKVKTKKRKGNTIEVELDNNHINQTLNTSFNNTILIIHLKGILVSTISSLELQMDDLSIIMENQQINFTYKENKGKIELNDNGYSMNYNDYLRMNVFIEEDKVRYNIVISSSTFTINWYQDKIEFSSNTQASIYNGMDITIEEGINDLNYENPIEEEKNPIIRYFKGLQGNLGGRIE